MNYYQQKGKEYLRQLTDIEIQIRMLKYRHEELMSEAEGLGFDLRERVQTSPMPDGLGEAVVRLIDEDAKLTEAIIEQHRLKADIMDTIGSLNDSRYKKVLFSKYVEHKRLETIALEMNYSEVHIKRLHRNALDEIGRIIYATN